jgi:DNA replication protein DnaC
MPRRPKIAPELEKAQLDELLHYLGLHTAAQTYEALLSQAAKGNWSHKKFLEALAAAEAAAKKERSVQARIATAHFPFVKTVDAFDFAFPRSIPKEQILSALSLDFIERHEGFVFLGGPGTGKSHLAIALGYAACLRGVHTRFTAAVDMINDLQAALAAHRLPKALQAYRQPRLLIIDEVGYMDFDQKSADLFFQVISARYERGSTILTTNEPFKNWGRVLANNTVASAVIDRLAHHNEVIRIDGDSYRVHHRRSQRKT